ncbi:MAG: methionyl-tRNA formyltransferase [Alphaproteobacteria bacterium]|nr:methionyl-tRNA formyltransferase [Alphaproteobacteria bacterium]
MRIVFMGTPEFAQTALQALVAAGHEIVAVYSQPPKPAGRGLAEQKSPVQAWAEARGIPVRTPRRLRDEAAHRDFAALGADVGIVAAYGLILPKPILEAPRFGCLNIHASLLPRWRGAAPIQRALLAGDAESGVTIMQMDEGLDTGAMLLREAVAIDPGETGASLHDKLAALGARLIVAALRRLAAGDLPATPQPADGVTYAAKLTRDEGRLSWSEGAAALERKVRAFTPWPGAWFEAGGERIKVLAAQAMPGGGRPGTIVGPGLTVACANGALRLTRVQRAGRGAMDDEAFLRGLKQPIAL